MSGKGSKAPVAASTDEQISAAHKLVQKKVASLMKPVAKKLKLGKDATEAVCMRFMEAQLASELQAPDALPVRLDDKLGKTHELLMLADERTLGKDSVEDLLAGIASTSAADMTAVHAAPCKRLTHLERLAVLLADDMLYVQATSFKYSGGLKTAADLLAKEAGGTFAKAWKPKAAPSIASKLYFRRGQTRRGWLADALQGRINCSTPAAVASAAAFFQAILDKQQATAEAADMQTLGEEPSGREIQAFSVEGLMDADSGERVDLLGTYLPKLSEEEAKTIGAESITVYRVTECAACREIEGLESNEVMLVNLMLMLPVAPRSGFAARLPEQPLACTMELQIGTAEAFKRMKKGVEPHDKALLFQRCPLLNKLQALANGAEGKVALPTAGKAAAKGGAAKGGDAANGKRMLELFSSIDLMHPEPQEREVRTFEGTTPTPEGFTVCERDRAPPGSRWVTLWTSSCTVFRIDSVTVRMAGKPPPTCKFSFLLSGERANGSAEHLFEEALLKTPVSRGELQLVSDGLTPRGHMLGNLSGYTKLMLEMFEPARTLQWVDLSDVVIKGVVPAAQLPADEPAGLDVESVHSETTAPEMDTY